MALLGIGLDLVDLTRFVALYGDHDAEVLARCFTTGELADVGEGADRTIRLAARFAAKEAVLKIIGGLQDGLMLTDIEVRILPGGAPEVRLSGEALSQATARGVKSWLLSLTHSDGAAAAVAIALS